MKKLRIDSNELESTKCFLEFFFDKLEDYYLYFGVGDVGLDDGCYFCHGYGVTQPRGYIALDIITFSLLRN
jgi:hypothetical protein